MPRLSSTLLALAWAQRIHAEGLGGRGGRRSRVVRFVKELLAQLQVVQDLADGEPGVALQVQGLSQVYLKVRAGHSLAAVHVDRGHPFL